jgi:quinol monooxygenase YgiN
MKATHNSRSALAAALLIGHYAYRADEAVSCVGCAHRCTTSGLVRGIDVWADRDLVDAVNSNPEFAPFNDAILPLLAQPAKRTELSLLHLFART